MIELLKRLLGKRPAINFRELINKGAVVVDVRTPDEFKAGHFPKSRNIPLDQVSGKLEELKKLGKPLILVCRSGTRAGIAKRLIMAKGMEVHNGGSWIGLYNKI